MSHPLFTPAGVEAMTQMARESITAVNEKIDRLEELVNAVENDAFDVGALSQRDRGDILEGLYLVINREAERIENLRVAVEEGELVVGAQRVVNRLSEAQAYLPDGFPALAMTLTGAIETIVALNEARTKGGKG